MKAACSECKRETEDWMVGLGGLIYCREHWKPHRKSRKPKSKAKSTKPKTRPTIKAIPDYGPLFIKPAA